MRGRGQGAVTQSGGMLGAARSRRRQAGCALEPHEARGLPPAPTVSLRRLCMSHPWTEWALWVLAPHHGFQHFKTRLGL